MSIFGEEPRLTADKLVLERLRVGARYDVSNYVLQNMQIDQWVNEMADSVSFRFQSAVLARTLAMQTASQAVEFQSPASTWQMFKHRRKGGRRFGWLARRWPVVMETTTRYAKFEVKQRAAFPDCTIRFPDSLGAPIFFQTVEAVQ